jgi:hypothetical protein
MVSNLVRYLITYRRSDSRLLPHQLQEPYLINFRQGWLTLLYGEHTNNWGER